MGTAKNRFEGQLRVADIITANVVLGDATAWTRIGSYQVPRGTAIELGKGDLEGQTQAYGRLYIDVRDNAASPGAEINGMLRIEARGPQGRPVHVIKEITTVAARSGTADTRQDQIPFPRTMKIVPEDWTIEIWLRPDSGDAGKTVGASNCVVLLDDYVYDYS